MRQSARWGPTLVNPVARSRWRASSRASERLTSSRRQPGWRSSCVDAQRGQPASPASSREARLPLGEVGFAAAGDGFAALGQLVLPAVELCSTAAGLEERVPLLQGPCIAAPHAQEVRFHVEQAPIEQAAAVLGAAGHQVVAAGLEGHHGQRSAEFAEMGHVGAVQPALPRPRPCAAGRPCGCGRPLLPTRRRSRGPGRPGGSGHRGRGHGSCARRPSGAWLRAREVLPAPLAPVRRLSAGPGRQRDGVEPTQARDVEARNPHQPAPKQNARTRPGVRMRSTWNRRSVTGGAASPRGGTSRCRPRERGRRSWRRAVGG